MNLIQKFTHMELWRGDTGFLYLDMYAKVQGTKSQWMEGGTRTGHTVGFVRQHLVDALNSQPFWHVSVVDRGIRMDSNPTEEEGAPTLTPSEVLRLVEIYERLL